PDYAGVAGFSYTFSDDGTTQGAADPRTATADVVITVTPINDRPVRTAGQLHDLVVRSDSGVTSLGLSGVSYAPGGGVDEAGQGLTFQVTEVPPHSLGDVLVTTSNGLTVVAPARHRGCA